MMMLLLLMAATIPLLGTAAVGRQSLGSTRYVADLACVFGGGRASQILAHVARPKLQLRAAKTLPTKVEPKDGRDPPGPLKRFHVHGRWQRGGLSRGERGHLSSPISPATVGQEQGESAAGTVAGRWRCAHAHAAGRRYVARRRRRAAAAAAAALHAAAALLAQEPLPRLPRHHPRRLRWQERRQGLRQGLRLRARVRGAAAVASFLAAVVTEIYLCDVRSCQEISRRNGRAQHDFELEAHTAQHMARREHLCPWPGCGYAAVVESPWSPFTSECQRFSHPPRLDKQPI
jgi:hypothetical protein